MFIHRFFLLLQLLALFPAHQLVSILVNGVLFIIFPSAISFSAVSSRLFSFLIIYFHSSVTTFKILNDL